MLTPQILLLLFLGFALAGALRTFLRLRKRRAGGRSGAALYEWYEGSLPSWRYLPHSTAVTAIHIFATAVLGIAALNAAFRPPLFSALPVSSGAANIIVSLIGEGGSIALVAFLFGSLLAFPLSRLKRPTVFVAVSEQGLVHGSMLLPWGWFSHFSYDRAVGLLSFYSAFSPDLPSLVSKPPDSVPLPEVARTLETYLPTRAPSRSRKWYQTRHALIPAMILVCLPLIAVGWTASQLPRELALLIVALSAVLLSFFGGSVITLYGFGVIRLKIDKPHGPPTA